MTDLSLRRDEASGPALAHLLAVLKELFSATPLGILLGVLRGER